MNKTVLKKYLKNSNINSIGWGYKQKKGQITDNLSYVFGVQEKIPLKELSVYDAIPPVVNGNITDVIEVGQIKSLEHSGKYRPDIPGGVSIGHYLITAGTLGAWVKKQGTDEWLILSNNHVLANCNNSSIGDAIVQPGVYDGGQYPADKVATLLEFVPIQFGGGGNGNGNGCPFAKLYEKFCNVIPQWVAPQYKVKVFKPTQAVNLVDCALAKPLSQDYVKRDILDIGIPDWHLQDAFVGEQVHKSGRTTEYTTGTIMQVDVSAKVNYGSAGVAILYDQIATTKMLDPGDSGSLLMDRDYNYPIGLCFAGSSQLSIANRIQNVVDALGVNF